MSNTIDQKVVEMRFDNAHFESHVAQSMSTLDNLNKKLKLTEGAKGLAEVNATAKKMDFSDVALSVAELTKRFSTMRVMGLMSLNDIRVAALNTGKRVLSALTIDPVKTGLAEYETKINAIQTILSNTSSKGTTIDDVTGALDELNTYADKTIYNFAEMTSNIGRFTAAGVGLEDSVSSIQGIANLAAASGSSSHQASTAMYQLSQALAAGTVKLMDWNSVVNAGMGGEKFQNALKQTAKEHGVAVDEIIERNGSFRESLYEGWISADILNTTLRKFTVEGAKEYADSMVKSGKYTQEQADALIKEAEAMEEAATKVKTFTQLWDTLKETAQSGWAKTWELIVGDIDEAKEVWSSVSDAIGGILGASADARNELLDGWKTLGGRDDLIESFKNIFESIKASVKPVRDAFRDIFPPVTVNTLVKFTATLKDLTSKLIISDVTADRLRRTFAGVFASLDIGLMFIKAVVKGIITLAKHLIPVNDGLIEFGAGIGDSVVALRDFLKRGDIFGILIGTIVKPLSIAIDFLANFVGGLLNLGGYIGGGLKSVIVGFANQVKARLESIKTFGDAIKSVFVGIWNALKKVIDYIRPVLIEIKEIFMSFVEGVKAAFSGGDFSLLQDTINLALSGGLIGAIVALIKWLAKLKDGGEFFKQLKGAAGKFLNGMIDNINKLINSVTDTFKQLQANLKAQTLMTIAKAIAILTASLVVLSLINSEKLGLSLAAITTLFINLFGGLAIFSKVSKNLNSFPKMCLSMVALSVAILVLAGAVRMLASIEDTDKAIIALVGVGGLMASMMGVVKILSSSRAKPTELRRSGAVLMQMMAVANAIWVVAKAVSVIGSLQLSNAIVGMVGVGGLMVSMMGIVKILSSGSAKPSELRRAGAVLMQMMAIANATWVVASAVVSIANIGDMNKIIVGMVGVGGLMVSMMGIVKILSSGSAKPSELRRAGAVLMQMMAVANATWVVASAVSIIGSLDTKQAETGITSVVGIMVALLAIVKLLSAGQINEGEVKRAFSVLIQITALTGALVALSIVCAGLAYLGDSVYTGVLALALMMGTLAVGMKAMQGTQSAAPAVLAAAFALTTLSASMLAIGLAGWGTVFKGLIAIGGGLIALAGGMQAMKGSASGAPAILAASAAVAILAPSLLLLSAVSWEGIARGLVYLASALGVLVLAGLAASYIGGGMMMVAGAAAILAVAFGLVSVATIALGAGLTAIATGIGALAAAFAGGAVAIVYGIRQIIIGIVDLIPIVIENLGKGFILLCKVIAAGAPALKDAFVAIVKAIIDAINETTIQCVPSIVETILVLILSLLSILTQYAPEIVGFIATFLINIINELAIYVPDLVQAAVGLLVAFLTGLADAFKGVGSSALLEGLAALGVLSVILAVIGGIAGLVPAAMGGLLALSLFLVELAIVMAAFGKLMEIKWLKPLIDQGAELFEALGNAIGSFIGGIAGGFLSGVTGEFPQIGSDLSAFMTNLKPFIEGSKDVDESAMKGVKALAEAVLILTAANVVSGITGFLAGGCSLAKFGLQLALFGPCLKTFSNSVSGIDGASIEAAANATKCLAEAASQIPNQGGLLAALIGDNTLSKFGEELAAFGPYLKQYGDSVSGVNTTAIDNTIPAIKAIAEVASIVPNQGGLMSWILGDNTLSKFGEELAAFGPYLKQYGDAVAGVNSEAINATIPVITSIIKMANTLPNSGGLISLITGDNSLAVFGRELAEFGPHLKRYSDSIAGINETTVTSSAAALKAVADAANTLPKHGGLAQVISGDGSLALFGAELSSFGPFMKMYANSISGINSEAVVNSAVATKAFAEAAQNLPGHGGIKQVWAGDGSLAGFGAELALFGPCMKRYANSIAGIDGEVVVNSANAAKALAELANNLPKTGGIKAWWEGDEDLKDFGEGIVKLGKKLKEYANTMNGVNASDLANSTACLKNLIDVAKGASSADFGKLGEFGESLGKLAKDGVNKFINAFKDSYEKVVKTGQKMVSKIIEGAEDKSKALKKAFTDMVDGAVDAIEKEREEFYAAGKYLVQGFADGISENDYKAAAKAKAMAEAAAEAAKKALDEHSPSRVFFKIGSFAGKGFVNALSDYGSKSYDAGMSMADSARSGLSDAICKIRNAINSDMDVQPTIRPVLDLSDVRSGAGALGHMLDMNPSVGVLANVGSINAMMNRRNQNGSTSDVVSAIDKLRKDFANSERASYNINGITYNEQSDVAEAVRTIVRAAKIERRT